MKRTNVTLTDGTECLDVSVCIAVVVFEPEPIGVCHLLAAAAPTASAVLLYLNSPLLPDVEEKFRAAIAPKPLHLLGSGTNDGLGSAFNVFIQQAAGMRCDFVVLFDQDSMPSGNIVQDLVASWQNLVAEGERPAVIGPLPIMNDGTCYKIASRRSHRSHQNLEPVDFVISSGS